MSTGGRKFAVGDVVGGDFEIVRVIGEGGMGCVYEARQKSTGALRAIKTMLPELARDADFQRRFAQEAQVVTKVESEHVVQVLSAGIDEEHGVPWIAMELLKGEDLGTRLARTAPLDYPIAREIFAQIGHAFEAAHSAGVVHRDLKPENVFVCDAKTSSRVVTVKILDFGIAKVLTSTITTSTGAMGSPLWMAPEQTVKTSTITPAADIWAFGLMAFYALTGRYYWHAPNGIGGTPTTLLREITLDPIESASARSKTLGGAPLPPLFDEWFARCLERDPAARFADANAAVAPLLSLLAAAPKRAPRPIDLMATQGVPAAAPTPAVTSSAPAPSPAEANAPAPAPHVKTDTAFANTEARSASAPPVPPRPLVLYAALAGAAVLVTILGVRNLGSTTTAATATPAAASARPSTSASRPPDAPMITFGGTSYTMGSDAGPDDERPPQIVSVAGFALDVHEVTVSDYLACVDANRCKPTATTPDCNAADKDKRNHPINCVTFADAKAHCEWVDKRLPSELEWELAARGGKQQRRYPWGSALPADQLCWRRGGTGDHGTCPVGSFPSGKTPEGLMDMAGNVWEWTTGRYCTYGTLNCTEERRVARGGSWASTDPVLVTSSVRSESYETDRGASRGFRCARSL
jgi:serine/threonine protein kinase/formylglycine-generating enzyme required for sulfatase activity